MDRVKLAFDLCPKQSAALVAASMLLGVMLALLLIALWTPSEADRFFTEEGVEI